MGLCFQRDKSSSLPQGWRGGGGLAGTLVSYCKQGRAAGTHVSYCKQEADRANGQGMACGMEMAKSVTGDVLPPARSHLLSFPK